jgi:hypothetical protein
MRAAPTLSDADVERGYNNRAAVPDHPQWFARWGERSAAALSSERVLRDLRYGSGPKETLDLFLPRGPARGTFVFLPADIGVRSMGRARVRRAAADVARHRGRRGASTSVRRCRSRRSSTRPRAQSRG